jgi:hypothetical protein
MRHRRHPHRTKRYVIQLPMEDGSGVLYWNNVMRVWVEADSQLQPTDPYSPAPSVFTEKPNALAVCGYANAVAVPMPQG